MALPTGTTITWYGHSCVRIDTAGGRTVIIDPWFANPTQPDRRSTRSTGATCCS